MHDLDINLFPAVLYPERERDRKRNDDKEKEKSEKSAIELEK